jgi:hypothetical protein
MIEPTPAESVDKFFAHDGIDELVDEIPLLGIGDAELVFDVFDVDSVIQFFEQEFPAWFAAARRELVRFAEEQRAIGRRTRT